ncbi:MAG: substrate-binding and vWA domain-containing protein [Ilumatobacteraceae bacterium]
MTRGVRWVGGLLVAALAMVGCTSGGDDSPSGGTYADGPNTLNILAGSELKDMVPILDEARAATGVRVNLTYAGSLDGAEQIAAGTTADAGWFGSDKYLGLAGASTKVLAREKIALSPVVIGVRADVAATLGWSSGTASWKDIIDAAGSGKLPYAMTNPTVSNSGFSALVSAASALAGGDALAADTIDSAGLKRFLSGQQLTAGSSGFLVDAFVAAQDRVVAMVNYESVLVSLNDSGKLDDKLVLVYPSEGIVTSDYPLMLLNADKRDAYTKLTEYLTRPAVQAEMQQVTARRAVTPGVAVDPRLSSSLLVEASFPANIEVARLLLDQFQSELRRPANTVYVLDTSGSMGAPGRLDSLQAAMKGLAGADESLSGVFTRFSPRENVTVVSFSSAVNDVQQWKITSSDPASPELTSLRDHIDGLVADGNTAMYSALDRGYDEALAAAAADPSAVTSIVLMTDGENNSGMSAATFIDRMERRPSSEQDIRVFTIRFGEADPAELQQVADITGGKVFDGRSGALGQVFKEIRGYQ